MGHGRSPRLLAAAAVVLVPLGVWIGHTLEYVRVGGTAGLRSEVTGSVHGYMLLLGAALTMAAAVGGLGAWRIWAGLGRNLDAARVRLARAWRNHPAAGPPPQQRRALPSTGAGLVALWLPIAAVQLALYVLQENVEARAASLPMPGLGAITGAHWGALPIHAGVAFLIAVATVAIIRLLRRRLAAVDACERLVRTLGERRRHHVPAPTRLEVWSPSPLDRFGRSLWRRPPPALLGS